MYHSNTGFERIQRGCKFHFLSIYEDLSPIAASLMDDVHSEEYVHQCALSRTILSD